MCSASRTASASPRAAIRSRWRRSCAPRSRRTCGRSPPTCRSSTAAESADPSRRAIGVRSAGTATTTCRWAPRHARPRARARRRPGHGRMNRAAFERLVAEAVRLIPRRFRREIKNLALVVEEEPSAELLAEMEIEPPDSLYGLYQGTPLTERTWGWGNALPDRITIYQRPIEEDCEDDDEMRAVIGETLIHEVGHYFGLSEEEIEEIEERYWRSETIDED